MTLWRLKDLSLSTAWHLFTSTVAPVVACVASVWTHVFKDRPLGPINRVRGPERKQSSALSQLWRHGSPKPKRISRGRESAFGGEWSSYGPIFIPYPTPIFCRRNTSRMQTFRKQDRSALYQVANAVQHIAIEQLENINPCTLIPCEIRVTTIVNEAGSRHLGIAGVVYIAVSSSARNGVVGYGGTTEIPRSSAGCDRAAVILWCSRLSIRKEQNPFSGR